jgi:hypothetical protein
MPAWVLFEGPTVAEITLKVLEQQAATLQSQEFAALFEECGITNPPPKWNPEKYGHASAQCRRFGICMMNELPCQPNLRNSIALNLGFFSSHSLNARCSLLSGSPRKQYQSPNMIIDP